MAYELPLRSLMNDIIAGKQLILFLGAGVNYSPNVKLLWEDLINPLMETVLVRMASDKGLTNDELQDVYDVFEIRKRRGLSKELGYEDVKRQVIYEYSPQIKALLVKTVLKNQYISAFQERIYSQCNRTVLREAFYGDYILNPGERYKQNGRFYTLYTIARMILLNPHIRAVVTYNYDNFLTIAINILQEHPDLFFCEKDLEFIEERHKRINRKKIKPIDIYGDTRPDNYQSGTIFIYHPHGFIPPPNESDNLKGYNIIMSMDEYCDNTSNVYSWDNDTQVHLLSHYTCIFMGSSISDLTTQRMLHYANRNGNKHHIYNLGARPTSSPEYYSERCTRIKENLSIVKEQYYKGCGLINILCEKGFNKLYYDLNAMTEKYVEHLLDNWHRNIQS